MTSRAELCEVTFSFGGKRYHVYGHTTTEAREKARARKALLEAGVKEVRGNETVSSWAKTWLEVYKAESVSPAWYKTMRGIVNGIIEPSIGTMRVRSVQPIDITRVLSTMAGRSDSYVHKVRIILNQIFEAAEDNGLTARNPVKGAKSPICASKPARRTISVYERELTLKTANKHPRDGLFVLLMLYCGLRPQEAAVLRRSDLDYSRQVLHVTRALKSDGTVGAPKSAAGVRDIPLPSVLIEFLQQFDFQPDEYLCVNAHGNRLSHTSIRGLWRRFRRAMELEHGTQVKRNALVEPHLPPDFTPYLYRHTYCTDLQDAGVPLVVAARMMGHSDVKITARIYTHASADSFDDALARIEVRQQVRQQGTKKPAPP